MRFGIEDAKSHISELGTELTKRESQLEPILPIDETYGLQKDFESIATDWSVGRKSVRTIPVVNVLGQELNREVSTETKRFLLSLDLQVNALDDIIDTPNLRKTDRISYASAIAQSTGFMLRDIPDTMSRKALQEYYTTLFQIPIVERRKLSEFEEAKEHETRIEAAFQVYRYRARDIDGFIWAFMNTPNLTSTQFNRLIEDLRAYRAKRLLYKDLADVERDLRDEDRTIVLSYIGDTDNGNSVTKLIEDVASRFEYSYQGRRQYGEILGNLEKKNREPLNREVEKAISNLHS